jgi:filamentous hemagglutinin
MPFANSQERADHFHKHGADFGAKNAKDYEAKADAFLLGRKAGEVRTYFRPVPGVTHKRSTNLEYFNVSCLLRF